MADEPGVAGGVNVQNVVKDAGNAADSEAIAKKFKFMEAQMLGFSEKEKSLKALEDRVDKKMSEFKSFVDKLEVQGKSFAGSAVNQTEEEKNKDFIDKTFESVGFKSPLE